MKMWLGVFLLTSLVLAQAFADGRVVATDGVPDARIVIAEEATPAARFAALELQYHLREICGAELPIVSDAEPSKGYEFLVGESRRTRHKASECARQEWIVEMREDATELLGRDRIDPTAPKPTLTITAERGIEGKNWPGLFDDVGSLFAVYEYLERVLGVRWVDMTANGTLFPRTKVLKVPTSGGRRGKPWAKYRGGTIEYRQDSATCFLNKSPEQKAYDAVAYPFGAKDKKLRQELFIYRHRAGGEYRPANHSLYYFYDLYWNEDGKHFVEKRPAYFAQGGKGRPGQLCYSNPDVIRKVVEDVRYYFDNNVWTGVYAKAFSARPLHSHAKKWGDDTYCLEPMDGRPGFCRCPLCLPQWEPDREKDESLHSTYWFAFVKKVAEEIKKSHPDKTITTLAYASHEGVPTDVRLPDNVSVYFCLSGNRSGGYPNPAFERQKARMEEWRRAYPKMEFGVWLYSGFPFEFAQNGGYKCFPGLFAHECARQYKWLKRMNAGGGVFHCGLRWEVEQYMELELMVDPDRDADEMLSEFFAKYGKAAEAIRNYYSVVEERFCDPTLNVKGVARHTAQFMWGHEGTPEVMERLDALMKEAERLSADESPVVKERVALWRMVYHDYMMEGSRTFQERARAPKPSFAARRVAAAKGDPDAVDWTAIAAERKPFCRPEGKPACFEAELRLCHDGEWLYVELREFLPTVKLVNSQRIISNDETEIMLALQEAQPYRIWYCGPNGRYYARSNGEVNWRQNVSPEEEGQKPCFGAVYRSDVSDPNCWRMRWAFRLKDQIGSRPVEPGETVYFNVNTVLGMAWNPDRRYFYITCLTPKTTVHTTDRMAKAVLEK